MKVFQKKLTRKILIIKKCHICGHMMESLEEVKKCTKCNKSFLPIGYRQCIPPVNELGFDQMFLSSNEIEEEDLIKGIQVIW